MDIKCRKCGEPWDIYSLHDLVEDGSYRTFDAARKAFSAKGCGAFASWGAHCSRDTVAHPAIGVLTDLLGDDIDGLASELEDFGL